MCNNLKLFTTYSKDRKHCGGKGMKCLLPAFSPIPTMFLKGFFSRVVNSQGYEVKFQVPGFFSNFTDGLQQMLKYVKVTYNNPEVILFDDGYGDCGTIYDQARIEHIQNYINTVQLCKSSLYIFLLLILKPSQPFIV